MEREFEDKRELRAFTLGRLEGVQESMKSDSEKVEMLDEIFEEHKDELEEF